MSSSPLYPLLPLSFDNCSSKKTLFFFFTSSHPSIAYTQGFDISRVGGEFMTMEGYFECSAADMKCDDPFDSIDDLLDFPCDDVLALVNASGSGGPFASPSSPAENSSGNGGGETSGGVARGVPGLHAAVAGGEINSKEDALGLYNDLDIANLEWLSNFFHDDSEFNLHFSATTGSNMNTNNKVDSLFGSLSPTSVLEPNNLSGGGGASSGASSCSSSTTGSGSSGIVTRPPDPATTTLLLVPARARTKRRRPQFFSTRSFVPPPSFDTITIITPTRPAEPEAVGEPCPVPTRKTKKKKTAIGSMGDEHLATPARKCMHCEIQKTPQWRAGPMGPKTLCNACGVRYKSGRLFPEYRPAASPTFLSSVHSNSHKKVVEMRLRASPTASGEHSVRPPEGTAAVKSCDLLEYIRRRD